jgi:hypothetical protein
MGLRLYFKINSVIMLGRDESGISDGSELEFLDFLSMKSAPPSLLRAGILLKKFSFKWLEGHLPSFKK